MRWFLYAGTPILPCACHPDWRRERAVSSYQEATMPCIILCHFSLPQTCPQFQALLEERS